MKKMKRKYILNGFLWFLLIVTTIVSLGSSFSKFIFSKDIGDFTLEIKPKVPVMEEIINAAGENKGHLTRIVYEKWESGYTDSKYDVEITSDEWGSAPKYFNNENVRLFSKSHDGTNYTIYILSSDTIMAPENAGYLFSGLNNDVFANQISEIVLHNFQFLDGSTAINVFDGCAKLTSLDMAGVDFRNVNEEIFNYWTRKADGTEYTPSLSQINNLNLSNTIFDESIYYFIYRSGYGVRLTNTTTLNVTNMDISGVTNLTGFCYQLRKLKTVSGLETLDYSNVTIVSSFFYKCTDIDKTSLINFTLGLKNAKNIKSLAYTFFNSSIDNDILHNYLIPSLNNISTNINNMSYTFAECSKLKDNIDISKLILPNITTIDYLFRNCNYIKNVTFPEISESLTNMEGVFSKCDQSLVSIDMSNIDTSNVTTMKNLFYICSNLTTVIVGPKWSTSKLIASDSSQNMFYDCVKIVGGAGTTYDSKYINKIYARVDNPPDNPGYLTLLENN